MNNKGFTLIEVLLTVVIIAIIGTIIINYAGSTLSISQKESYEIMKNNIVSSSYNYINECNAKSLLCELKWENNKTSFTLIDLKNAGYFDDLKSPIDNKELGTCINLIATRDNGNVTIELIDNCY